LNPPGAQALFIEGPVGALQASIEEPAADSAHYGVVCHPHPLYGGTMDNKVVTTLARALNDCGIAAVRFNFRSVGKSAGSYGEGLGETDDALAVIDFCARRWPDRTPLALGFSFGGYIAWRVALQRKLARLITVAPAITRFEASLERPDCPWLVVQGDADDVIDPQAVIKWSQALKPPPQLVIAAGVGHFFHGHLQELRAAVVDAIRNG
jgi:uncharacterized protein